jgi:nitrous oxidase accessory protein NosD
LFAVLVFVAAVRPKAVQALTRYVAPHGSDRAAGTEAKPFKTIGYAVTKGAPGDIIVVAPGVYRENVTVKRSGSAGRVLTIRGLPGAVLESPDPNKSLSAFDVASGVAYVRVQGFELRGGFAETVFVRTNAHDIELSGLTIQGNRTGIWIAGGYRVAVRDTVLRNNFRTGVRIFAGAHDIEIVNTRSEGNNDGAGCDGDSDGFNVDTGCRNVLFDNAAAIGNSEDGFDLQGRDMTLLRATSRNNQCSGIKVADGAYIENALVVGNKTGINIGGAPATATVVTYSTVVANDLGVRVVGAGYRATVSDSIISGPAKALEYDAAVNLIESRNVLARPRLRERLIVQNGATQALFSGDDINAGKWARSSGQGNGTVARDPALDSAAYTPASQSPAIDSAQPVASIVEDHDGNRRPAGRAPDRGAIERQTGALQLRLRAAYLSADATGCGRAQVLADLMVPNRTAFDLASHGLTVVLGGHHGPVMAVELPAAEARAAQAEPASYRAAARHSDGSTVRLSLRPRAGGYTLFLRGRNVDTWRAPDGTVTVDVTAGTSRARTTTTLAGGAGVFTLR